jgi:ubiquitin carboxyl-terminal hydrolase 7
MEAEKNFTSNDSDWGFKDFLPLSKLYDLDEGFLNQDGTMIIECVIHLCDEKHLINPLEYDSRKETGFVGLQNQGATCYMNSLLQTLYIITYFRKAVYHMPIDENEKPVDSIPLALMRVFYRLQNDKGTVGTKELTKSFGWDTADSFLQHDVQELARVLIDNLEKKMEKTDQKNVMKYLFEGQCKNYVKCVNVNYESSRTETFYDLQLNVKGCKNVYQSFEQYIEEEMLEGENQYQAEGHGLQDAKKGTIFLKFPNVLMMHLKRFEYDFVRDLMFKINDRYEFYSEVDLTKYLSNENINTYIGIYI